MILPSGKLPPQLLRRMIERMPVQHDRLIVGPGEGLDCAVVDYGDTLLVLKSDPITFATDEIGWYSVQVNANDIATTGATPRWFSVTALLPEGLATPKLVETIADQIGSACREMGVTIIGGHTEITIGLSRPILAGTMIGEVPRQELITPAGARPGDAILLTKGIPIEATAILMREMYDQLYPHLSAAEIEEARNYLYQPGISVLHDAQTATRAGLVTAMHDPTEGGLAGALWELACACGHTLVVDPSRVPIPDIAGKICNALNIDPMAAIASGALLMTVDAEDTSTILEEMRKEAIPCHQIGVVEEGVSEVLQAGNRLPLPRPARDEIARLFEG